MNKEEIKHFKAMLRQGLLRHMNILLDDKFQKELLNIIKDYEKLQQENQQLKEDYNKVVHEATEFESSVYELKERINKAIEYINKYNKVNAERAKTDIDRLAMLINADDLLEILKGVKDA